MPAKRFFRQKWSALWLLSVAIFFGLLVYVLFGRLGVLSIADYDEARHGVNAYEMIRNDDYLVSTYQGETDYWNLKPPLSFWLIALAYRIFGYNAFALRFFSALSTLLASVAVALWAYRRTNRWAAPFVLVFFVANNVLYGLHFSRFGDADAQYQLFFTLAALCALQCDRDVRWIYGSGLFFGLAFLEKGMHACVIPPLCFLILLLGGDLKRMTLKNYLLLVLSGLVFIVPWAVARYTRDGTAFFSAMFSTDVSGRVGSTAGTSDADLPALLFYLTPFSKSPAMLACVALCVLCLLALSFSMRRLSPAQRRLAVGCTLWVFVPIAVYSIANVKYRWYVYSVFFAVPSLTCVLLFAALRDIQWKKTAALCLCATFAVFAVYSAKDVSQISSTAFHDTIQDYFEDDLDRNLDSGVHAYIQYNENKQTVWMQGDMLSALFYGDVVCMDGGVEAYLEDDDSAILYVCKADNTDEIAELEEEEIIRSEDHYIVAFEK